jgi:ribose transport system ATP-binding protein
MTMSAAIQLDGLTKVYDGVVALSGVTHAFEQGQVHALMGKNGSGKSTLVRVLSGAVGPTLGTVEIHGRRVAFASPRDAFSAGVITIYQELSLVPSLTVGENIFLGRLPKSGVGLIVWDRVHAEAARLLRDMGQDIDPRARVGDLSVGQQQTVEIVKAMSLDPKILLLDEPTSALATREVDQLFALIRRLRARGITMVYITHRMNELAEIADTCTVLRDGRLVGSAAMADIDTATIVDMMFGDTAHSTRPPRHNLAGAPPVLEVEGLTRQGVFSDIGFTLRRGEILGLAGLLGAGRTEILRAIFGADRLDGGIVRFAGQELRHPRPQQMKRLGLGYTPENRKEAGLVQLLSSHANLVMASNGMRNRWGFTSKGHERLRVATQVADLDIKVADTGLPVASLSGGNQQKVVIGNWLNTVPTVMFLDEPTRGVDVRAKRQIFDIMWRKAEEGLSIVFVSSELEEVLEVADRILVLRQGRLTGEVDPTTTGLGQLYWLCMGGQANAA